MLDFTLMPSELTDVDFITIKEAADLLRVHVETIRRAIRDNQLKAVRLGHRTVRIPKTALQAWYSAKSGGEVLFPELAPAKAESYDTNEEVRAAYYARAYQDVRQKLLDELGDLDEDDALRRLKNDAEVPKHTRDGRMKSAGKTKTGSKKLA